MIRRTLSRYGADALFAIQVLGGLGLMVPMMIRNWTNVEGVSISFFLVLLAFCALQTSLALPAHRALPTRKSAQALGVYLMWLPLTAAHIGEIWWRGMYRWDTNDTVTLAISLGGMALVYGVRRRAGSTFADPIMKSQLAMATRGIPQLLQGGKIWMVGGGGVHGAAIAFGNLNIWIRIGHLLMTRHEATWDANRRWLLASEVVNALSWGAVSLVWLAWRLHWI